MEHYGNIFEVGTLQAISGTFSHSLTISGVPVATGTVGGGTVTDVVGTAGQITVVTGTSTIGLSFPATVTGTTLNFVTVSGSSSISSAGPVTGQSATFSNTVSGTTVQAGVGGLAPLNSALDLSHAALGNNAGAYIGTIAGTQTVIAQVPAGSEWRFQNAGSALVRMGNGTPTAPAAGGWLSVQTLSGTSGRFSGATSAQMFEATTFSGTTVTGTTGQFSGQVSSQTFTGDTVSGTLVQVGAGPLRLLASTTALTTQHGITRTVAAGTLINAPTGEEVRLTINGGNALRVGAGTPTAGGVTGYASAETFSGTSGLFGGTVSAHTGAFSTSLTVSGIPVLTAAGNVSSYTHTQASPATTWSVTHSLGTLIPHVTVYNAFNEVIMPNTASGVSLSTYELKFNTSIAGKAFFTSANAPTFDLGNLGNLTAATGTFTVVTGTTGQFGGTVSAQTGTFDSLTVSGVAVPLLSAPYTWASKGGTQSYTASAEVDVTGLTGLPLPTGHFGSTNGRTYRATGTLSFNNGPSTVGNGTLVFYYGPNGGRGENSAGGVANGIVGSAGFGGLWTLPPRQFTVTSGTATKFGVAFSCTNSGIINSISSFLVELVG